MTRLWATPLTALPPQFGPHAAGACPTRLGGTYSTAYPAMSEERIRGRRVGVPSHSPAPFRGELPIMVMGNYRVGMSLLPCPSFSNMGEPRG